ncbi:MAG TPA: SAM-dependent methyltransferase, partial [Lachnospiraceae bacterium]|nr:SAM-dependent methyltransferase [Lachnospiraceae bacterium]
MAMYESFAQVYDKFMDNVPYDSWAWQLCRILSRYGIDDGLVLDLGCGTGQMTRRLRDRGYDMIGVDGSEDMLQVAMEHEQAGGD